MKAVYWQCFSLLVGVVVCATFPTRAFAQYATESAQTTVTATIEDTSSDTTAPSTPVLISPSNNSRVTTNTPDFVWEESTDENGIDHYRLSLDGSTLFDSIPTSDTDNSFYTLTYNGTTHRYTLVPKSGFSQGSHTWRVGAYDPSSNLSESATWTFTVDTQAPTFIVSQIGTDAVSISAQDWSTIPDEPISLEANEPLLGGTGETSSSVQLVLTIPDDPTQNISFAIDGSGNWNHQLGLLPRDVIMTMDFTITDLAGNVSVLNGVRFVIPTEIIVFPPPSPTPSASASAAPSSTPTVPGEITPTPTPSPAPFQISIPVVPPREILNEVIQEIGERVFLGNTLIQALPADVKTVVEETLSTVAPLSAVVAMTAVPVVATFALAAQFGSGLSLDVLFKILQALGLIPAGKPQGFVFESSTYEPVPFALLSFRSLERDEPLLETVVSDVNGIYKGIKLPPGSYQVTVSHQEYHFPTAKPRPAYLQATEFYRGETFLVSGQGKEELLLVPLDKITETHRADVKSRLRVLAAQISRRMAVLIVPLFILSLFLTVLFPTIWNIAMCVLYGALVSNKIWIWFKSPLIVGSILDTNGQPIEHAIIRLNRSGSQELSSLISSHHDGHFAIYAPKGKYELSVTKPGFVWYDQSAPLSSYEIDATNKSQTLVATMKAVAELEADYSSI